MSNIYNLFKFLEKKKGTKTPLEAKLIYAPKELTDEELNVERGLYLSYSKITSLPDNLQVGGDLSLLKTPITSLPDNLKVEKNLYLQHTPLSRKYNYNTGKIRKMIEDKGGYVNGSIYV